MARAQTNETRLRQHEHHAFQYAAYQSDHHAEVNQAARLVKHLRTHPGDACALAALGALPAEVLERVPWARELVRGTAGPI